MTEMIYRFGDFELDEARRALRLRGRELLVQPRVFDVLAYLVRHRDRVVSKDELLDEIWQGVHVTEGSLQRAMSLARSALRQGGADSAIRAYARQGYRFCIEAASEDPPRAGGDPVGVARRAYDACALADAVDAYAAADRASPLPGLELERWADAAYRAGRIADAFAPLERATAAHAAAGDHRGAARAALLLTKLSLDRGDHSVASGWLQRASTYLRDLDECSELGLLQWTRGRIAMASGDHAEVLRCANEAHAIAVRCEDPDLETLALLDRGIATLALGEVDRGIALIDEAAASVIAGELSPRIIGLVYCGVIWVCRNRGDWRRASEWTDQFSRWRERLKTPGFPGLCQLHRAEVLHMRGDLATAADEARRVCERLSQVAPWAEGEGYRVMGEIELALGRLDAAEAAFRRAHALGWEPQPGLALLQMARGRPDAALRGLEQASAAGDWANRQRRALLLGHVVLAAAQARDVDRAERALQELEALPERPVTPAIDLLHTRGKAELALARGDVEGAITELQKARQGWLALAAPLQAAEAGMRLAQVLVEHGDAEAADLQLSTAEALFERSGAPALRARCAALRASLAAGSAR